MIDILSWKWLALLTYRQAHWAAENGMISQERWETFQQIWRLSTYRFSSTAIAYGD